MIGRGELSVVPAMTWKGNRQAGANAERAFFVSEYLRQAGAAESWGFCTFHCARGHDSVNGAGGGSRQMRALDGL